MGVEWLKRLLSEHHMTQGELAEKLGVSKAIVSSWLSGVRRIPVKRLKEIARLFSLSEREVFNLSGVLTEAFEVSPEVVLVPILSSAIPCGTPREAFDEYIEGLLPVFKEMLEMAVGKSYEHGLKIYFIRAEGDSMLEAGIIPGSFVLFSPDIAVQPGDIAILEVDEEGLTIKQVFFRDNTVVLTPRNSQYAPRILDAREVSIKGKVLFALNYLT
ncbi:MAG: LexA family protein, partial [Candidatus Caldatribacteriaceae bacterium]